MTDESPVRAPPGDMVSLHDGGKPQVQSMFIDLWKPTHNMCGQHCQAQCGGCEYEKAHVVLHEETIRQLKSRVRGGNAYTLVHTVTVTSDVELVPDMCPEKQSSIYDGYNVAHALGFVSLEMYSNVWQANVQMKRDWHQYSGIEGRR